MSSPRILLLGKDGQVGAALQQRLVQFGEISAHNRSTCDIGNSQQLRAVIRAIHPQVIVNAAAYTAVDKAESEVELCHRINAEAPGILAEEARVIGAWLVHYSTDYVFDGMKASPYSEDDTPSPLSVYGKSKLAGDAAVAAATEAHTILRVSWVYGPTGRNFAKTILKLALERDRLQVVADQFGAPTSVDLIADVTTKVLQNSFVSAGRDIAQAAYGTFNLAPSGRVSWHQYAVELVREAKRQGWPLKLSESAIIPITTDRYATAAVRPKNSLLCTTKICGLLNSDLPPWHVPLASFVSQISMHELQA